MNVLLLVVTMTGTAEMLAEDVVAEYGGQYRMRLVLAERCSADDLRGATHLLVLSSTYGEGEVPDPGKPLFAKLEQDPSQLAHLHFGVISLGDSVYADTFANGGKHWDRLLKQCGATPVSPPLLLDASSGEDFSGQAVTWAGDWLQRAVATAPGEQA